MENVAEFIKSALSMLPKAVLFLIWVACAFLILPCVFIAGTLYPAWSEWGEKGF